MILLLDAGNSRCKWAILRNGHFEHGGVFEHRNADIKELASAAWSALDAPAAVLVANVVGDPIRRHLNSWMKRHWKVTPEYLGSTAEQFGIRNAYAEPASLGVDRWLALLAARELYQGPLCIVDCGTALTVDVLSQDDRHLGGVIVPGLQLMRESLLARAKGVREGAESTPQQQISLLGTDTGSAVAGGTLYAIVAVVDRMVSDLKAEMGKNLRCIVTGGDAPALLPLLRDPVQHEPELVLQGIARIARTRLNESAEAPAQAIEPQEPGVKEKLV